MGNALLECLFEQHVMELLLLMAQHAAQVTHIIARGDLILEMENPFTNGN